MAFRNRLTFRTLLGALSFLGAVAIMLQGCAGVTHEAGSSDARIAGLSVTSGPVGTSVTITGTNFGATQGTSTVTFNGTAGVPTSWSATVIVVPVPSGATTGNVVVTVGGVASNGVMFTVTTTAPKHREPECDVGPCGDIGDDHRYELRSDAGDEHGKVQWDGRSADELECDGDRSAGAERSDDGERGGDGRRGGEQRGDVHTDDGGTEHREPERDVGACGDIGDDHRYKLRSDAGDEHGKVQRDGRGADELECDGDRSAGAERSDDGECGGDGRRGGEQRGDVHTDDGGTKHREPECDIGPCGDVGNDYGHELRSDAGDEHGDVQWDGRSADELECDGDRSAGAERSDDGECGGDGRRGGEQRGDVHTDDGGTKHREPECDIGPCGDFGNDYGHELRSDAGDEHGDVQWDGRSADELECDGDRSAGAERSDDGECGGDGRRGGEQRGDVHGDDDGTEHREPERDVGACGDIGDDHRYELRSDAGDEHGKVQRDGRSADELECDGDRSAGAERSDDGERGGDGRGSGEQRGDVHGDDDGTEASGA